MVAIGSGKGGVGKSTVALNLGLALAETGRAVGILDADVFGPDIPLMMNLTRRRSAKAWDLVRSKEYAEPILPAERYGLKLMSSAFIIGEDHPLSLESSFVDMILRQFLNDVEWGELDYLFVDLPPGTADLQQTVVREYPLSGSIVVVTPQDVAHLDAKKVVSMYRKAGSAILGGIENMGPMACPHCDERIEIFPRVPEERSIWSQGIEMLGSIPVDAAIGASGNAGPPVLIGASDSAAAWSFRTIADRLVEILS